MGAHRNQSPTYCMLHLFITVLIGLLALNSVRAQPESSLMGLISPRDIAQITQLATDIAAQTMNSNAELLSKPGRPEVRPIAPMEQSASEMLGQSITNLLQPASQQFASQFVREHARANGAPTVGGGDDARPRAPARPVMAQNRAMNALLSLGGLQMPSDKDDTYESAAPLFNSRASSAARNFKRQQEANSSPQAQQAAQQAAAMNSLMQLANTFLGAGTDDRRDSFRSSSSKSSSYASDSAGNGGGGSTVSRLLSMAGGARNKDGAYQMPMLRQFLPMADNNFGVDQGEGCLPFLGEFMKIAYGNCVKQADQRTWDTWGKEIENALMGGKIDLLKASRETCKKGAEREQCGQVRRAVSECDIIGSIQLITTMQRSVDRCDQISGIIDQNPQTVLSQMNGLINGEMAQGFLNNFLG